MATFLILLVILAVIAGMVWMLRGQKSTKRRHVHPLPAGAVAKPGGLDKLRNNKMFWGVRIGNAGCAAALALKERQYSFDEAPELPVPGCDSAHCTCQFMGLRERRTHVRRTHEDRRKEIRFDKEHPERRSPKGRRRGDKWGNHSY